MQDSGRRTVGAAALDVLAALVDERCPDRPPVPGERRPEGSLLAAGMIAGADSIDDLDLLRDGVMAALFGGIRAPSTLGSFLRSFTWGRCAAAGEGEPDAAGRSGPPCPAAARQGHRGVR
jgi:hypothetical protein